MADQRVRQTCRADDVRGTVPARLGERLPCAGLGGQVNDGVRMTVAQKAPIPRLRVAHVTRMNLDIRWELWERVMNLGVEGIEDHDLRISTRQCRRESGTDETSSSGDENAH